MKTTTALTTLLAASALAAGAVASAGAGTGDTTATVGPPRAITAGHKAPFDAPGVRAIRRGKPIPRGYVLVGRTVSVDPGRGGAGAALRITCPTGKTLRTFANAGDVGGQITRSYVRRRSTVLYALGHGNAEQTGTLYGVCR